MESANRFLELVKYTAGQNELVSKVVLENAPKNNQMICPEIQKDIVHCFAEEVIRFIIQEVDHDVFCVLVDKSADVSDKEQMAVPFRFVDKHWTVKERFIGLVHVKETISASLKCAIDSLFAKHGLSMKQLRGQGYDGASNMKGEFNGLRSLILRENSSAYYIHCFAHQLELVVVAVAKKHFEVGDFFDMISVLVNVVGASCKRKDMIREEYRKRIEEVINRGEIKTGKGLNQLSLQRPGNTRWDSHYTTLLRLVDLFSIIIKVLEYIEKDGSDSTKRRQANGLLKYFNTFDFVFYLQLMLLILGLTNSLSVALQRKDQDILNAMSLVKSTKQQLCKLRDDGWDSLLTKVFAFCENHDTELLIMDDEFVDPRKPRKRSNMTNLHHYQVECFYTVLDMQIQEFNDRFDEVNTELLGCVASLSPIDSFHEFDPLKVMRLSEFYPKDFTSVDRISLEHQLGLYIDNIREDERFANLKSLGDLAHVMVETRKYLSHPQVYQLLKLVLTLPIAIATVERCFSAMNIVKTSLRNRIGDKFLNDCLVSFIEKELFDKVTNDIVMKMFQDMKERRITL
ncbi:PREDICTED: zinc finger MYM-type protein 1-like [Camelina sativa]|uniref:Zinc finger MYM-type protein 1-like n=1 Tax=Camelina sativa TaxID=90675 RepID=A0ABM1QKS9_CAMSA|nr:PREDICTED: zinc finger MYM-type protein 1-like [Camelina sativa]